MNIGDYVRTKDGLIAKYIGYEEDKKEKEYSKYNFNGKIYWYYEYYNEYIYEEDFKDWYKENVIKSSPNIIDLIEVGDYVNGTRVYEKIEHKLYLDGEPGEIFINDDKTTDEPIESIVTKEQFEAMEYRIGE